MRVVDIYTDGATSGNPGVSGAGIYIKANNKTYAYAVPLGMMSNHEAEFHAVIQALDICLEKFPKEILAFSSDSQLVVDTIEKGYTKNKTFQPLLEAINEKANAFSLFFIKWIPSQKNVHADKLAKQAILKQQREQHKHPYK